MSSFATPPISALRSSELPEDLAHKLHVCRDTIARMAELQAQVDCELEQFRRGQEPAAHVLTACPALQAAGARVLQWLLGLLAATLGSRSPRQCSSTPLALRPPLPHLKVP